MSGGDANFGKNGGEETDISAGSLRESEINMTSMATRLVIEKICLLKNLWIKRQMTKQIVHLMSSVITGKTKVIKSMTIGNRKKKKANIVTEQETIIIQGWRFINYIERYCDGRFGNVNHNDLHWRYRSLFSYGWIFGRNYRFEKYWWRYYLWKCPSNKGHKYWKE